MSLSENKKARLEYSFLEEYHAGVELFGHEVKSIREGKASIKGAYVVVRGGEAYLVGASIQPYQPKNTPEQYDPERARRLLLTKKELHTLMQADARGGLTIVPISLYNKGSLIKLHMALAKGRKKHDKRDVIKERDMKREQARTLKYRS